MATLQGWNQEEEQKNGQQSGQLSTGSATLGSSSQQASPRAPTGSAKGGTGFVNLQRYLSANKDQTPQFTDKVTGNVQGMADNARSGIQNTWNQFQDQSKGVERDDGVLNSMRSGNFYGVDTDKVNGWTSGNYGGPTGLQNVNTYQDTQKNVASANTALSQTGTSGGRYALLGSMFGKNDPRYSRGETRFDQAVLQADEGSRQKFDDLRTRNSGLTDALGEKEKEAGKLYEQNSNAAQALAADTRSAIEQGRGAISSSLSAQAAEAQRKRDEEYNYIRQVLSSGKAQTKESLLRDLGVKDGSLVSGDDLTQYLSKGRSVSTADVASDEQRRQIEALKRLGGDTSFLQSGATSLGGAYGYDAAALNALANQRKAEQAAATEAERQARAEKKKAAAASGGGREKGLLQSLNKGIGNIARTATGG